MLNILIQSTAPSCLKIRPDKCSIFYERRSRNRWYNAKSDKPPEIEVSGEVIEVLQRKKPFTYLGNPLTVAGELQNQPNDLSQKYKELLLKIENSFLPIALKIEALECIAMASIQHHFANTYMKDETISEFDKALTYFYVEFSF